MKALTDSGLLDLWESGVRRHPLDRAVLILGAAHPDAGYDTLADWPLGRRNRSIAQLRRACFGGGIHGWMACPRCGDKLEFELDARALAADDAGDRDRADAGPIVVGERAFRLPTSRDLASIATEADPHRASIRLVENCLIEPDARAAWSDDELEEIGDRMAQADPLAETRLALECPSCAHAWEESFDIASFLWEEIEARARRIVFDVHALASAYGWTEAQILALSASRRALYLEMARA
jgi:hypothetical protein